MDISVPYYFIVIDLGKKNSSKNDKQNDLVSM